MGLFGSRRDKDGDYRELVKLFGLRSEVLTREGRLIFFAQAEASPEGGVMMKPITVSRLDPSIPRYPVMLRGYQAETKRAIHISCYISARKDGNWDVKEPELVGRDNDRAFYRLETAIPAEIVAMQHRELGVIMCQISNVSAGGACILTAAELSIGEKLSLRSMMLESMGISPMMCMIRRAAKRKGAFEYGVKFLDLSPQAEEHLVRTIMDMEQQKRAQ